MERSEVIKFEGQKVFIREGEYQGKTGILKGIIDFYDDVKKNALCEIKCEQKIVQIREADFRFVDSHIQEAWESGGIEIFS